MLDRNSRIHALIVGLTAVAVAIVFLVRMVADLSAPKMDKNEVRRMWIQAAKEAALKRQEQYGKWEEMVPATIEEAAIYSKLAELERHR